MNKILLKTLVGHKFKTPPIWLMRQAGRYLPEYRKVREEAGGLLNLCYDPEKASKVTLQPLDRFGFDASSFKEMNSGSLGSKLFPNPSRVD